MAAFYARRGSCSLVGEQMRQPEFPVRGSDTAHAFGWGVLAASSPDCWHLRRQPRTEGFRSGTGFLCGRIGVCRLRAWLSLFDVAAQAAHSPVLVSRMATVSAAQTVARKHRSSRQNLLEQHCSAALHREAFAYSLDRALVPGLGMPAGGRSHLSAFVRLGAI